MDTLQAEAIANNRSAIEFYDILSRWEGFGVIGCVGWLC
jgi:hypothetical protein